MYRSRLMAMSALAASLAIFAAPANARQIETSAMFLPRGDATDAPRGYVDMCAGGGALCDSAPLPAAIGIIARANNPSLQGGADIVTGAIRSNRSAALNTPDIACSLMLLSAGRFPNVQPAMAFSFLPDPINIQPGLLKVAAPLPAFEMSIDQGKNVGGQLWWQPAPRDPDLSSAAAQPSSTCNDSQHDTSRPADDAGSDGDRPRLSASPTRLPDTKHLLKQLKKINGYVNGHVRQTTDLQIFGRDEVWQRSGVGSHARGDCEDLAIEKRLELLDLGFDPSRLFFAVVYMRGLGLHTVLIARLGDGDYVLDSRTPYIERWNKTGYSWLSVQDAQNSASWYQIRRRANPVDDRTV